MHETNITIVPLECHVNESTNNSGQVLQKFEKAPDTSTRDDGQCQVIIEGTQI